jgi:hypothetical protein
MASKNELALLPVTHKMAAVTPARQTSCKQYYVQSLMPTLTPTLTNNTLYAYPRDPASLAPR